MSTQEVNPFVLHKAIEYAATQHVSQSRKNASADPYILHPFEVMMILKNRGVTDLEILSAAVLHDTVEDTGSTSEEISGLFGNRVSSMVMECSDNKSLSKVDRKKLQIEHSKHISDGAKLVKLSDKYSNIKSLLTDPPAKWTHDEIVGYAHWGFAVCQNLYGINEKLDTDVQKMFKDFGIVSVTQEQLEAYYSLINRSN